MIKDLGQTGVNKCVEAIQEISKKYMEVDYWERLNVNPCSKYQYYTNHIHVDTGIYLSIGKYVEYVESTKKFYMMPLVQLEVNPNKHHGKPILKDILDYLKTVSDSGTLKKYDYTIDIPLMPDDVQIFGSRKEKGLYKGTRYFGQRNKNGYCKIYDKQKEQKLETPMTRVEHTISCTKTTKEISFENIYIKSKSENETALTDVNQCIVNMALALRENGLDFDEYLKILDKRKKRVILEGINQSGYEKIEFDKEIHKKLLDEVFKAFYLIPQKEDIKVNQDGFMMLADDYKNPWDE